MTIKNYTTGINYEKTIMEIENILANHGATDIFKRYEDGIPKKIAFAYMVNEQYLNFMLPMEEDKILQILRQSKKVPNAKKNIDQARRTGWRIIKDWVDSQMALIQIRCVKFEQVFLPYMYDMNSQETIFQKIEKRGFNLQIENKSKLEEITK